MTDLLWQLCTVCEGNGVVKIPGGISTCDHCRGSCREPDRRPVALAPLVDAVDRYMAAKGGADEEWAAAFNALMKALQAAKREMEHG